MSRQILCLKCGDKGVGAMLADEKVARGWTARKVYLSLHTPPQNHGYTDNGRFCKVDNVHCDLCNEVLNGGIVVAVSRIPPDKEMRDWEQEYGRIIPPETVDAYRGMSK